MLDKLTCELYNILRRKQKPRPEIKNITQGGKLLRVGEIRYNTQGTPMRIVEFKNSEDVTIEFLDLYRVRKKTIYVNFKSGQIKNPYDRNVRGVGYYGEGKYTATDKDNPYVKKAFQVWSTMLDRCYRESNREMFPTYENCLVCDEWHNYQKFREWYDTNYYQVGTERMHVDKDILYKNNRVYSPETCLIVPQRINMLFMKKPNKYGYPNGIKPRAKGRFEAKYNNEHLGVFDTIEEASIAHDKAKKKAVTEVANEYKDKIPDKVYQALINWIPDYIDYSEE